MKYKRLRDLREDYDLSQDQLGSILNISQKTYSNYETGYHQIPIDILIQLALFYQTSVDYLLGLTDVKTPYPYTLSRIPQKENIVFSDLAIVAEQDTYINNIKRKRTKKKKDGKE